ncbi:MAG: hypothetical protein ACYDDB_03440 [bacterium]
MKIINKIGLFFDAWRINRNMNYIRKTFPKVLEAAREAEEITHKRPDNPEFMSKDDYHIIRRIKFYFDNVDKHMTKYNAAHPTGLSDAISHIESMADYEKNKKD